jgi:hypothetical protein
MSAALPSRRREIVDEQKNPLANKFITTQYANARRALIAYFATNCTDESILDNEIERLQEQIDTIKEKDPRKLKNRINKFKNEQDALNAFKGLSEQMDLRGIRFSKTIRRPKHLNFSGVDLSIAPEILVTTKDWEIIGCIKFYFKKNDRLKEDVADFLCAILNHYADTHLSPNHRAKPEACMVIDVFRHRAFRASKNAPLHRDRIRSSCKEISEIWPTIEDKNEADGDDNQIDLL